MQLMIATGNPGKLSEIESILQTHLSFDIEIHASTELSVTEPDEPYDTFIENSRHKAKYYADLASMATLSEDSGLCIEALDGFPGTRTKDFAHECGGLELAFTTLQSMLATKKNLAASFVCAATIYLPQYSKFISYEDSVKGHLSFPPRGEHCFGFDPIFIPKGYTQTTAELGPIVKNKISHRNKAVIGLLMLLEEFLQNPYDKTRRS